MFVGGTDSSGGAGLFSDIKTAAALGIHGCPVISAVTAQLASGVRSWLRIEQEVLSEQLLAVIDDGPVSAVKTGMLCNAESVETLHDIIVDRLKDTPLIIDPVLKSGSGDDLSKGNLLNAIREYLIPISTLVTPNIEEAGLIARIPVETVSDMKKAGEIILSMGTKTVLVKGGHLPAGENISDILVTAQGVRQFDRHRIDRDNVHGTGCTFAASAASLIGAGYSIETAVEIAGDFTRRVISGSYRRKSGLLPGHFPLICSDQRKKDETSYYLPPTFCSKCGNKLSRKKETGEHLHCSACGYVHYRNPLPAVALLVQSGDSVLLTKRAFPPHKGELCFPGGFLEIGETYNHGGNRELHEETGLTITESSIFDIQTDMTTYGGILLVALKVTRWKGTLQSGDDAEEVMWIPLSDVPNLAFKAHNTLLEKLRKVT